MAEQQTALIFHALPDSILAREADSPTPREVSVPGELFSSGQSASRPRPSRARCALPCCFLVREQMTYGGGRRATPRPPAGRRRYLPAAPASMRDRRAARPTTRKNAAERTWRNSSLVVFRSSRHVPITYPVHSGCRPWRFEDLIARGCAKRSSEAHPQGSRS